MEQRFAALPIKLYWLNAPMSCRQTIIPAWFSNVMKERFAALPVELHWLIDPTPCRQTVKPLIQRASLLTPQQSP